jgi:hypothetical protein
MFTTKCELLMTWKGLARGGAAKVEKVCLSLL